jgi:hypothetical protein
MVPDPPGPIVIVLVLTLAEKSAVWRRLGTEGFERAYEYLKSPVAEAVRL